MGNSTLYVVMPQKDVIVWFSIEKGRKKRVVIGHPPGPQPVFKVQTRTWTIPDLEESIDLTLFQFRGGESALGIVLVISFSVTSVDGCECLVRPDPSWVVLNPVQLLRGGDQHDAEAVIL